MKEVCEDEGVKSVAPLSPEEAEIITKMKRRSTSEIDAAVDHLFDKVWYA